MRPGQLSTRFPAHRQVPLLIEEEVAESIIISNAGIGHATLLDRITRKDAMYLGNGVWIYRIGEYFRLVAG